MRRLVKGFEASSAEELADKIDTVSDRWDELIDIQYHVTVLDNGEVLHSAIGVFEDEDEE